MTKPECYDDAARGCTIGVLIGTALDLALCGLLFAVLRLVGAI